MMGGGALASAEPHASLMHLAAQQTTMPAPHRSVFTGWIPFLTPHQQCQSTVPDG